MKNKQFNIRITDEDRKIIEEVAAHFDRSESDAVRVVFRELYDILIKKGLIQPTENHA